MTASAKKKPVFFPVEKLFVFGAGASFAATRQTVRSNPEIPPLRQTPLDGNFTKVLSNMTSAKSSWVKPSVDRITKSWKDHKKFEEMGLEEAMSLHLANIHFTENIRYRSRQGDLTEPRKYLRDLIHLISFRLVRARQGYQPLYEQFADTFFSKRVTKNRIITFNYDAVLDNILLERYSHNRLYFHELSPVRGKKSFNPVMLKMHGSVNWQCSSDDFLDALVQDKNSSSVSEIHYREKGCPRPEGKYSPCIIPPIGAKPVGDMEPFPFLWNRAYKYLRKCKELYVCGYSLPPADGLAYALFRGFQNQNLETVYLIDPDLTTLARWKELLSRPGIGGAGGIRWLYFSDFGEFLASLE